MGNFITPQYSCVKQKKKTTTQTQVIYENLRQQTELSVLELQKNSWCQKTLLFKISHYSIHLQDSVNASMTVF